jgi:uncharacterized protein with PIN domain
LENSSNLRELWKMSRIRKFYENRFSALARKSGKPPEFADELFSRAAELSETLGRDFALALVHADNRRAIGETADFPLKFFCDAGLGGLARWLRAAGYESEWHPQLDDAAVIRKTEVSNATLLTTDTLMMERGVLRDGILPAICVPSSLTCEEQLAIVFRELGLELREARCMKCGGELRRVPKESVADRIPPKTARWMDEYFVCARCDQLFWRGTHWQKIVRELERLNSLGKIQDFQTFA